MGGATQCVGGTIEDGKGNQRQEENEVHDDPSLLRARHSDSLSKTEFILDPASDARMCANSQRPVRTVTIWHVISQRLVPIVECCEAES